MTRMLVSVLALVLCAAASHAQQSGDCTVPNYMLFGDSTLERLHAAAVKTKAIKVVVVGSTSSTLPGRDGPGNAYPARLEAWLQKRLPGLSVTVTTHAKPRQTAQQMAEFLGKVALDEKPNLVVWQTGTYDALKGVAPEDFRASVAAGVEKLHDAGSDVIIMNMQYSPRTELVIPLAVYADSMRWVAREFEVPLFDRLAVMRHWFDSGAIDLYGATKDTSVAKRVHDCIARALTAMIVDAARLEAFEGKAAQ